jgi:hypothetical protein
MVVVLKSIPIVAKKDSGKTLSTADKRKTVLPTPV